MEQGGKPNQRDGFRRTLGAYESWILDLLEGGMLAFGGRFSACVLGIPSIRLGGLNLIFVLNVFFSGYVRLVYEIYI
jgi:hypothetical protein